MPLTGANRAKRFIDKLKSEGKYEEFKLKRRVVNKKSRVNIKNKNSALPPRKASQKRNEIRSKTNQRVNKFRKNYEALHKSKIREQTRNRVRKHRENQKILTTTNKASTYQNETSRRKAFSRAQQGLPKSLDKRNQIR